MIVRLVALLVLPILAAIGLSSGTAHAATFDPGRIIDDVIFTNASTMSVAQIQNFLNSKVPTCDTNGTLPASDFGRPDLTHAQYAAMRGWQAPPYTCLKDFNEGGRSAAQIIYDVSQQYQINPQVFIVLLQKESSLVTDTWPLSWQYRSATGYGCPDSTPGVCDSSYYGFTNQVSWAGRLFRSVINQSPGWYSPYVKGQNFIQWSPIASCGGSIIDVQNWSTAALYDYTPYQPNASALNAGYGMGDSCGAYGNRNFWLYFNDWFGSTLTPNYSWQLTSQYAYTDASKTTPANLSNLMPGQRAYIGFTAKNTGNQTWHNSGVNPVRVGTVRDANRSSSFYDSTWIGYGRPASLKETSVAPGAIGTFEFWVTAPAVSQISNFSEYFSPLAEGLAWMGDLGMYYALRVSPPTYTWQVVSQTAYSDPALTATTSLDSMGPGEKKYVRLVVKNTGNMTWSNSGPNPINLGTSNPRERTSAFADGSWLNGQRAARMKEASVAPGQNATFEFALLAPTLLTGVDYSEYFTPVAEGVTWMNDLKLHYDVKVKAATYTWQVVSQTAYSDPALTATTSLDSMGPGEKKYVRLVVKNTGNMTWSNSGPNPINLGTSNPRERTSAFADGSWLNGQRAARMKEASVAPGQNATFEFALLAPTLLTGVDYSEYFTPVAEGVTWMNDLKLHYDVKVKAATYTWQVVSQTAYSDPALTATTSLDSMGPGEKKYVRITFRNTGNVTLVNSGPNALKLGTSRPFNRNSVFVSNEWLSSSRPAALAESSVAPGEIGIFVIALQAPSDPKYTSYSEHFMPVSEWVSWLSNQEIRYVINVQ